jgi:hypothetical protein
VAPAPGEHAAVSHEVEAGEQLGSYRQNVDYNVVDESVTLPGLLVPEHYAREPWKIHTPDPFEYFTDEIRDLMLAKSLRNGDPAGGKIDYDIAGRLVGNWFREGTNGYAGSDPSRYWGGHLAVAYDHIDPSHVIVSIGTFDGAAAQFAVRGNGPDPAEISATTGPVLYELVMFDYWVGEQRWDRRTLAKGIEARNYGAQVRGVVLFEVLASGKLRMETFPGVTATSVDGFTTGALVYER